MPKAACVVFNGRTPGVYYSWAECDAQIKGFSNQNYHGYETVAEAEEQWRSHTEANEPDPASLSVQGNMKAQKSNPTDVHVYGNVTNKWYAVARGREPGVHTEWPPCESQISGFPGPKFKRFDAREEAVQFVRENR